MACQSGDDFTHERDPQDRSIRRTAARTFLDIVWETGGLAFTATASTTTLTFASTDPVGSKFGIALDDVRVIAGPGC